ncbi:MAG: S41 family peptidase [Clostridia bacterium]|nr:S41 family peptidase [Clostridia bacterium]
MNSGIKGIMRRCAAAFAAVLMLAPTGIYADDVIEGKHKAGVIEDVIGYLSVYSRYDEVTQAKMFREGLLKAVENNPELYGEVMKTILESIDENSEYYNPEETKVFLENISGEIYGIGITFDMCADGVNVVSVIPDTPAARGGLEVGDIIVSADDTELAGMKSEQAASYIKGAEGTAVRLGIKRKGEDGIIYIDAVREKIVGNSVSSHVYDRDSGKIMYIRVFGFVSNTAERFKAELDSAAAQGIDKLIIDLRDNGGGIFDQAIKMADYLVPKGSTITTEDHKMEILNVVYNAVEEDTYKFNTAVLINENSASAAEVLTAALSENGCAYVVGKRSYGKGTIQTISNLPFGDCMKYTMGYYLTPKGNNVHKVGIAPDLEIDNTYTPFEIEKYPKFSYMNVYDVGGRSDEVKTAKELLQIWGAYNGVLDDVYDEDMSAAVYRFQAATGLYPYGVLDLTTQRELYTRMEKSKVMQDNQLDAAFDWLENAEQTK